MTTRKLLVLNRRQLDLIDDIRSALEGRPISRDALGALIGDAGLVDDLIEPGKLVEDSMTVRLAHAEFWRD